jgi:cobalt-zinc-cadmium efflux system outer membrane protein
MEANFAEIEAARSLARVLTARREARSAALTLGRLLGVPEGTVVQAIEASPERLPDPSRMAIDRLLAAALTLRPDVRSRVHLLSQSETLARLARREVIPDVGVGALVTGGEAEPSTRVGLRVSLPLPMWNRNQGPIAARDADVRGARLDLEEVELTVRSEVADAYQAYVMASEEEALILERVLEPARRNQELLDVAYREGEIDLPSLVLLRNQLFDAETGYWDAWLARRHSLTRLQAAVGDSGVDLEAQ